MPGRDDGDRRDPHRKELALRQLDPDDRATLGKQVLPHDFDDGGAGQSDHEGDDVRMRQIGQPDEQARNGRRSARKQEHDSQDEVKGCHILRPGKDRVVPQVWRERAEGGQTQPGVRDREELKQGSEREQKGGIERDRHGEEFCKAVVGYELGGVGPAASHVVVGRISRRRRSGRAECHPERKVHDRFVQRSIGHLLAGHQRTNIRERRPARHVFGRERGNRIVRSQQCDELDANRQRPSLERVKSVRKVLTRRKRRLGKHQQDQ